MGGLQKVNVLKINKRGGPNKVRGVGKVRKINKRGKFIWHLRIMK